MSANTINTGPVGPDTLITVKVLIEGQNRRFKLPLRDLGAHVLPQKLRILLQIPGDNEVVFERYSDSASAYIVLDSTNPAVYKQLYRAAKAKLKLRLKVNALPPQKTDTSTTAENESAASIQSSARNSYLETVLADNPITASIHPQFSSCKPAIAMPTTTAVPADLSRPTIPTLDDFASGTFSIDCNNCGRSVANEHYHCTICEQGDFDLCIQCIDAGVVCDGEDHWLIKRAIAHGRVYPLITETIYCPKKKEKVPEPKPAPVEPLEVIDDDQRTCNSCIIRESARSPGKLHSLTSSELPATAFVTCQACPDFDLCFLCLEAGEHGHHPAHAFTPVDPDSPFVSKNIHDLCQKAHGFEHEAVCDGCDAHITGVRHKCLSCPDFDYCNSCVKRAAETHPVHRFAAIYEHLGPLKTTKHVHKGIYCDGPVCTSRAKKTYIKGDRYKCAVCHDTDFCANCEALPTNEHNKNHPLIKIRTPWRQISVAAVHEFDNGAPSMVYGDRPAAKNVATETVRTSSANAATQVQTVGEVRPSEMAKDIVPAKQAEVSTEVSPVPTDLQAWFESDSTPDGSSFSADRLVSQTWTLRNPGPQTWPAGCAVYFIGGDDMRNLDDKHPSPVSSMIAANMSNALAEPLEPGKTAEFSVLLKSPSRAGRAISYWRLKTPEGLPFGHKLWVDITVDEKVNRSTEKLAEAPAVVPVEAAAAEKSQDSSVMIFPKLEKESPESSVNDIKQEAPVAADPSVTSEDQDVLDDLESMGLEDESTEDGFMTDEEYDILDADDEEFLVEAQRPARK